MGPRDLPYFMSLRYEIRIWEKDGILTANVLQRHYAEGSAATAERTVNLADADGELDINPGIREQPAT